MLLIAFVLPYHAWRTTQSYFHAIFDFLLVFPIADGPTADPATETVDEFVPATGNSSKEFSASCNSTSSTYIVGSSRSITGL